MAPKKKNPSTRRVKKGRRGRGRGRRITQRGGRFIDKGTYGAVFTPPPCNASKTPGMDLREGVEVGKLMPKGDAADELKALRVLQARLGSDPYFLIEYLGECEPDPANPDIASDAALLADLGDKTVLRYAFGGITWNEYVAQYLTFRPDKNVKPEAMNKRLELYIRNLHSLFYGLKRLQERDVFHRDIKINNALVHAEGPAAGKPMRFIDFGMATIAEDHNRDLRSATSMDHPYWPLDAIVGYTKDGLDFLELATLEEGFDNVFYDKSGKETRYAYLMFLGYPRGTKAERMASYKTIYARMRESVILVLNREFQKDEYALLHPVLTAAGPKNRRGNIVFDLDNLEDWWDSLEDDDSEVAEEMRRLYRQLQNRVRLLCMSKFDSFSLGYSILKLQHYLMGQWARFSEPGFPVDSKWVISPDIQKMFDTLTMIAKNMINPDIIARWGPTVAEAEFTKMFDAPGANAYIAMRKAEMAAEEARRATEAEAAAAAAMLGLGSAGEE
jgi:hypothetical protein